MGRKGAETGRTEKERQKGAEGAGGSEEGELRRKWWSREEGEEEERTRTFIEQM